MNLVNTKDDDVLPDGLIGLHATSLRGAVLHTNESIYGIVDRLRGIAATSDQKTLAAAESRFGMHFEEHGLLFDDTLRGLVRPAEHYLRDWMHTFVNGGLANVEIFHLIQALRSHNIEVHLLQSFSLECILPKKHGKVSDSWLDKARLSNDSFSSFAAIMLTIIPIVACFLVDCVKPHNIMHDHIRCFLLLHRIVGLLRMGADNAAEQVDKLAALILEHHALFEKLYPRDACKPKYHHALHLPGTYARIRKVVSCFVTERKHRTTKAAALHVFRHIEHTVLSDLVNRQCEQVLDGHSLFQRTFLVSPLTVNFFGHELQRSTEAVLECGHIHKGDVVYLKSSGIARVVCFWKPVNVQIILAQVSDCVRVPSTEFCYTDSEQISFVDVDAICDAVIHRYRGDRIFRVILPFVAECLR